MTVNTCLVGTFLFCSVVISTGWSESQNCQDTGWEKIEGVKPESISSQKALFSGVNSKGIVKLCFERCMRRNCTAFVLDFGRSVCYSVEADDDELVPEANSTYYHRICIKVPERCKEERLWQVERSSGAVLLDPNAIDLGVLVSRRKCYEECMNAGRSCKSAQFRASRPLSSNETIGKCSLSMLERGSRPQAYRASMYRDEYLQSQCRNVSKDEYCSYAEFRNLTLPYSDSRLSVHDENECETRCDRSEDGFICRGYTLDYSSGKLICLLHSADTASVGVSSLIDARNIVYKEREPCLNVTVRCTDASLTVELKTKEPFHGRIYASGHSETCGVQGIGRNVTVLTLALPKGNLELRMSQLECGLIPAFSIDDQNRTRALVWATIVVQFNPIIQRMGDQAVRVGCSLDNPDLPEPRNISVYSSFSFLDPNAGVPPIASTVVNQSTQVPAVTMRILNEQLEDAIVTQLGQKLILRIETNPANGPYDIAAGHLVASSASGDASYLLLDEAGCPTDPSTFPALLKDPYDNRSLISTFTAFKFPDSQLVRFNVIVRFCLGECVPATCRASRPSYGRKRRDIDASSPRTHVAEVTQVFRNETPDELPLQLSIIVQSPVVSADRLSSREGTSPDTVLIAGGNSVDGLLCVDASLALSLLIFWLIIQIVLIVGCLLAVAQYRRMAVQAEEDRADILARHLYGIHGGNFEIARRVRWADRSATSSIG